MKQKNRGFFILLILFVSLTDVHAQATFKTDSLNNIIERTPQESLVPLFDALDKSLITMSREDALRVAGQSQKNATGNPLATILALRNLGNIYTSFGDKTSALNHYQQALNVAQAAPQEVFGLGIAYFQLGQFFNQQGLWSEGLQYLLNASQVFESLNLYRYVILCHYEACLIQYNAKNFQQSIQEGHRVLELHEKLSPAEVTHASDFQKMSTYNTIALAYREMKQFNIAIANYDKAEEVARKINNEFWVGLINGNKAVVLKDLGRDDDAIASLMADYETSKKFKVWISAGMSALSLCEIYTNKRDLSRAQKYLDSAYLLFKREKDIVTIRKGLSSYWESSAKFKDATGDHHGAYEAMTRHVSINDSLYHEQESLNMAKVKATYDLEHKQNEIELLTKNNEIQKERIRNQNTLFIATLIGLILLVFLVITLVYNFRRQHNISRIIRQQRDEIEGKNAALELQSMKLQENNQYIQALNTQLEQKVADRTRELEVSNKELDTFLYRSSHDIRRPITTLLGLDQVARHVINDPQTNLLFDKVVETARNMDSMLFKMQMMYELNKDDMALESVNVTRFIEDLAKYFRPAFEKHSISNTLTLAPDVITSSNLVLLRIVIANVLENSINFRKQHPGAVPFIDVTLTHSGNVVEITVTDNGIGIEEKYQSQVCDLHFRASQASKGNGLGLYLVKKAIQKLKGEITIMSDYGVGTTLTIRFQSQVRP